MAHLEELTPEECQRRVQRYKHTRPEDEGQKTSSNFLEENKHKTGQDFVNAWLNYVFSSNGSRD